jgi:hypothetical protein
MTKAEQFAARVKALAAQRERAATKKLKKRTTRLLHLPAIRIPNQKPQP